MFLAVTLHVAITIKFLFDFQNGCMWKRIKLFYVNTAVQFLQQMLHCLKSEMYFHRPTVQQTC